MRESPLASARAEAAEREGGGGQRRAADGKEDGEAWAMGARS